MLGVWLKMQCRMSRHLREQARSHWAPGFQSGLLATEDPRGSELAREKRQDNAGIQAARVIVDVHREQARSYRAER
jgi:hypothetical protein